MLKATVAGRTLELHGCDTMAHADKFLRFAPTADTSEFRMCVQTDVPFTRPEGTPIERTSVSRTYAAEDGGKTVYRLDHKLSLCCNPSFSEITLRLSPQTDNVAVRQYLYVLQCVSYDLLSIGGSLLHSAGLVIDGCGVALAGRSQVGKSTMARRCLANDPSIVVACEDAPAVMKRDGAFCLCGTPFCGDDELCANVTAPLKGVVFLEQAPHNALREPSVKDAMFRLLEAVPRPVYREAAATQAVELVTEWLSALPCLVFENDGSEEAGAFLLRELATRGWITERTNTI